MGTGIHGWVERKYFTNPDSWRRVLDISAIVERDYPLFARLFGVNNSLNFPSVAPNRGLPNDVDERIKDEYDAIQPDYHSPSYITWEEIEQINWEEEYAFLEVDRRRLFPITTPWPTVPGPGGINDAKNWQEIEQINWEEQGPEFTFQPFRFLQGDPGLTYADYLRLQSGETVEQVIEETEGRIYQLSYKKRTWKLREALFDGWVFLFKLLKELDDYYRQKEVPLPGYSEPSPVHPAQQESLIRVVVWFDN